LEIIEKKLEIERVLKENEEISEIREI